MPDILYCTQYSTVQTRIYSCICSNREWLGSLNEDSYYFQYSVAAIKLGTVYAAIIFDTVHVAAIIFGTV